MLAKRIHDITSLTIRKRGINDERKLNNIENISNDDILPSNKLRKECLYYVTGWLLIAIYRKSLCLGESNYMQNQLKLLYDDARETGVGNLNYYPRERLMRQNFMMVKYAIQIIHFFVCCVHRKNM